MHVIISNLAPVREFEEGFYESVIESFSSYGYDPVFWSGQCPDKLLDCKIPLPWDLAQMDTHYTCDLATEEAGLALIEEEKWLPRVETLVKQSYSKSEAKSILRRLAGISYCLLKELNPVAYFAWNSLCPHTGVAYDMCDALGIRKFLIERGNFPQTWFMESGGLVGHSSLVDKKLEELVNSDYDDLRAVGREVMSGMDTEGLNRYAQRAEHPGYQMILERARKAGKKMVVFFPPDDNSLGMIPVDHEDRRKHLPHYESSYAASLAIAKNTDFEVIFKPHPSMRNRQFDDEGVLNHHVVDYDFNIIMEDADIVAGSGSGLELVALMKGKPVMIVGREMLLNKGVAYECLDPSDIKDVAILAANKVGFEKMSERFEVFVGYLYRDFLISPPTSDSCYKAVDFVSDNFEAMEADVKDSRWAWISEQLLKGQESNLLRWRRRGSSSSLESDLSDQSLERVVLDFDLTLMKANSTELFIATAGPKVMADYAQKFGELFYKVCGRLNPGVYGYRDYFRVWAVILLVPWSLFFWRLRAKKYADEFIDEELYSKACANGREVLILSCGFSWLIKPLVKVFAPNANLVCSSLVRVSEDVRTRTKIGVVRECWPDFDGSKTLSVTDSLEDADLLVATRGHLIEADDRSSFVISPLYWPLRYTTAVKYGKNWVFKQIIRKDLLIVLLAFASSWQSLMMLPCLYFALMCIYEIGYYENDHRAAKNEKSPTVGKDAQLYKSYAIHSGSWCCAVVLSCMGLFAGGIFSWHSLAVWSALLLVLQTTFYIYNRTKTKNRPYLYPVLQLLKFTAFGIFLIPSVIGTALIFSQICKMVIIYWIYRSGGEKKSLSRAKLGLSFFIMSTAILFLYTPITFDAELILQLGAAFYILLETQVVRFSSVIFDKVRGNFQLGH